MSCTYHLFSTILQLYGVIDTLVKIPTAPCKYVFENYMQCKRYHFHNVQVNLKKKILASVTAKGQSSRCNFPQ